MLSDIIQGNAVTKTVSNTQTQVQALPYGTATEGTSAEGKLQHTPDYINYYAGNDTQDSYSIYNDNRSNQFISYKVLRKPILV